MVEVCASGRVSAGFRSPLPLVYQAGGTSTDSTDNGWLDRSVGFTKRLSATYIRITWSDTARLHDWGASSANYRLMICDARSSNCLGCTDPGELRVGRYVHQHGASPGTVGVSYSTAATACHCLQKCNVLTVPVYLYNSPLSSTARAPVAIPQPCLPSCGAAD